MQTNGFANLHLAVQQGLCQAAQTGKDEYCQTKRALDRVRAVPDAHEKVGHRARV